MKKKKIKRELRRMTARQETLELAQRRLAAHIEVIAVAVRSPDRVPQVDLDNAIAGVHDLNGAKAEPQ